jgi:hypothetical protein
MEQKPKRIIYTKGMGHLHPLHGIASEIAMIIRQYEEEHHRRCHCCGMPVYSQEREELVAEFIGEYWPTKLPKASG